MTTAHFIWLGHRFPWVHWLALASASQRSEVSRIVVHHSDSISSEWWPLVRDIPRIEIRRLEPEAAIENTRERAGTLVDLFRLLRHPRARSNVLRAALLYTEGGIYIDFDTITLAPLAPLLDEAGVFCGAERLAFPADLARKRHLQRLLAAWARTGARDLMRRLPQGWRWFRSVEGLYPAAVNNAILGARPRHPLIRDVLVGMAELPERLRLERFALGTHLLQRVVAAYEGHDLVVHPPEVFYPLGPEISEHWFRASRTPPSQMLGPSTRVVHWYASVRTERLVPQIDPRWVHEHQETQPFSALARQFLDTLDRQN